MTQRESLTLMADFGIQRLMVPKSQPVCRSPTPVCVIPSLTQIIHYLFSQIPTGAQFEIVGTIDTRNNEHDLSWHCFVDEHEVQNHTAFDVMPLDNNWQLCNDWGNFSGNGVHTMKVNVNATFQQPFWFDWMRYTPEPGASLENLLVRYDRPDPALLPYFSSQWDLGSGEVSLIGGLFEWEFVGASLHSFILSEL